MQIGTVSVENPLFLAPMAGVTDWAFRTVCAQLGAGVTITEMVSSRALVYKDKKTAKLLRKNEGSLCGAQIFGNDPATMAEGPSWLWKSPAVTSSTSIWAAPCRKSQTPATAPA